MKYSISKRNAADQKHYVKLYNYFENNQGAPLWQCTTTFQAIPRPMIEGNDYVHRNYLARYFSMQKKIKMANIYITWKAINKGLTLKTHMAE